MKEKEEYLSRAIKENWLLFFEHDPVTVAAIVKQDKKSIVINKTFIL